MSEKILYNAIATFVSTLSGLVRNKIFAAFLSINLFGILSIAQQSAGLLFTFCAFGIPLGITALSSQLVTRPLEEQIETVSRIVVLFLAVSCSFFILLAGVLLVNPSWVARIVTNNAEYAAAVGIILIATPFIVIENSLYAVMEGMGRLKNIVAFKIVPAVAVLPVLYILTSRYSLLGAATAYILTEIVLSATGFILLRKLIVLKKSVFRIGVIFPKIFRTAILSFILGVTWLLSDFVVKRYVLGALGETSNGIVQSVAKVTDLYPTLALSWLAMHLFPVLAAQKGDKTLAARTLERTTVVSVALIVPVIVILFAFRSTILEIIYNKDFLQAKDYFGAMLATGIPKVYSWVLGMGLLAVGLRKHWFYGSLLTTAAYLAGSWAGFYADLGIFTLPLTFGSGLIIQAVYCLVVYRRQGVAFDSRFMSQSAFFAVFTVFLVLSVSWTPMLYVVAIGYVGFIYHFKLLHELREKLHELFQKPA